MIDLANIIIMRLRAALAGQLFFDPEMGGSREPLVKIGALSPKRSDPAHGEDFPFVLVRPMGGGHDPQQPRYALRIIAGIAVDDDDDYDILAGYQEIDRMTSIIMSITVPRDFDGYGLAMPVTWRLGMDDDGTQPHPYYYMSCDMVFSSDGSCGKLIE